MRGYYVWTSWDQNPEALRRFAFGLWMNQISDQKTGRFSRHADYPNRKTETGYEFPQTGSCYIDIWGREYASSGDPEMKRAIQTLLKLYRSMRDPKTGAMAWCTAPGPDRREVANLPMNLGMATTLQDSAVVVETRDKELAGEMRAFAREIDDEYLSNDYDKILDVAGKGILGWYTLAERVCMAKGHTPPPKGFDGSIGYPLKSADGQPGASLYYLAPWFTNRSYAGFALLLVDRYERCEEKHKPLYRRAILETAELYMTLEPEVQFVLYPDDVAEVVKLLRSAHRITGNPACLHRADRIMKLGVRLFFDDVSPLPKISNFDDWYESSTKNGSSVEILRQMLELSRDLAALPAEKRTAPEVCPDATWTAPGSPAAGNGSPIAFAAAFQKAAAAGLAGTWNGGGLRRSTRDVVLRYGPKSDRALYLSQPEGEFTADVLRGASWDISLSDAVNKIPTAAEADKINGTTSRFTGKGFTTAEIDDAGFKDVARQVAVLVRNDGAAAVTVRATATLHDTYHDSGSETVERRLAAGEEALFVLDAPPQKWIRRLKISGDQNGSKLCLRQFAFIVSPRNQLAPAPETQPEKEATSLQKPPRSALLFLIAGQSNAEGVALLAPKFNKDAVKHPALPGSTSEEIGVPITAKDYPRSYLWDLENKAFAPLRPGKNLMGGYKDRNRHGIELPLAWRLEQAYPGHDIFIVKYARGGTNLYEQWNPKGPGRLFGAFAQCVRLGLADLRARYPEVQIVALYWDQGESDKPRAADYEANLTGIVAAFRKLTNRPDLPIFLRKHLFQHDNQEFAPIIAAQQKVAAADPHVTLLDLDLGTNAKNFKAWAWTDNNGHLSSKAYLTLTDRMLATLKRADGR